MKNKNGSFNTGLIVALVMFILVLLFSIDTFGKGFREGTEAITNPLCDIDIDKDGVGFALERTDGRCPCDYEENNALDKVLFYRVNNEAVNTAQWNSIFTSSNPEQLGLAVDVHSEGIFMLQKKDVETLISYLEVINREGGSSNQEQWEEMKKDISQNLLVSLSERAPTTASFCDQQICTPDRFKAFYFLEDRASCETPYDICLAELNAQCEERNEKS